MSSIVCRGPDQPTRVEIEGAVYADLPDHSGTHAVSGGGLAPRAVCGGKAGDQREQREPSTSVRAIYHASYVETQGRSSQIRAAHGSKG